MCEATAPVSATLPATGLQCTTGSSPDQKRAEQVAQGLVEREAALLLGSLLVEATTEWLA
jgi:hypothetical protein